MTVHTRPSHQSRTLLARTRTGEGGWRASCPERIAAADARRCARQEAGGGAPRRRCLRGTPARTARDAHLAGTPMAGAEERKGVCCHRAPVIEISRDSPAEVNAGHVVGVHFTELRFASCPSPSLNGHSCALPSWHRMYPLPARTHRACVEKAFLRDCKNLQLNSFHCFAASLAKRK